MSPSSHLTNLTTQASLTAFPGTAGTEFGHEFGWRELFTFFTVPAMMIAWIVFALCLICGKKENIKSIKANDMQNPGDVTRTMEDLGLI